MDYDAIIKAAAAAVPAPRQTVPGLVAHIDGDALAYHAAGPDDMPPGQCRHNVLARVQKVKRLTGAETVVMHLTCPVLAQGTSLLNCTDETVSRPAKDGPPAAQLAGRPGLYGDVRGQRVQDAAVDRPRG